MKSSDIDNELLDQAVAFAEMWGTEQNWPHVRDAYVAAILRERKALALRSRPASALPVVREAELLTRALAYLDDIYNPDDDALYTLRAAIRSALTPSVQP